MPMMNLQVTSPHCQLLSFISLCQVGVAAAVFYPRYSLSYRQFTRPFFNDFSTLRDMYLNEYLHSMQYGKAKYNMLRSRQPTGFNPGPGKEQSQTRIQPLATPSEQVM